MAGKKRRKGRKGRYEESRRRWAVGSKKESKKEIGRKGKYMRWKSKRKNRWSKLRRIRKRRGNS